MIKEKIYTINIGDTVYGSTDFDEIVKIFKLLSNDKLFEVSRDFENINPSAQSKTDYKTMYYKNEEKVLDMKINTLNIYDNKDDVDNAMRILKVTAANHYKQMVTTRNQADSTSN